MPAALLVQFGLGAIYAWSVFTPVLHAAGWTRMQTQAVFSLKLFVLALVMIWTGRQLDRLGPRRLVLAGGLVTGGAFFLAGAFGGTDFRLILPLIGLMGGLGIGLGYLVPIAVGIRWFPDRKGLISGVCVAGFGFGAMGWVKLAGSWGGLLQRFGMSSTLMIYGLAIGAMVCLGGLFMSFPPGQQREAKSKSGARANVEFTRGQMLRAPQFYSIFFTFMVSAGAGLMAIGLMKLYPMEALTRAGLGQEAASAAAGTAMAVFFSLANGAGRILWGMASDRLGRRLSLLLLTGIQGLALFAFIPMAGTVGLLYLGAAIIGFNFGGNFSLFPALTADVFGAQSMARNYPLMNLAYGFGGLSAPLLGGWMGDLGRFPLAFGLCGALCLLGSLSMLLLRPVRPPA